MAKGNAVVRAELRLWRQAPAISVAVAAMIGRTVLLAVAAGLTGACASGQTPTPAPVLRVTSAPVVDGGGGPVAADVGAPVAPGSGSEATACPSKCAGLATRDIVAFAQGRAALTRRCYNDALAADRSVHGGMAVRVTIAESGQVCSTYVVSSDMPANMNDCVVDTFSGNPYPPPTGGCLEINIPLSFKPLDAGAPAP